MDAVEATKKFVGSYVQSAIGIFSSSVIFGNIWKSSSVKFTEDFNLLYLFDFSQTAVGSPVVKIEQELVLQAKSKADLAVKEMQKMARVAHPVLRLAGLSGAAAVILGAYGAHGIKTFLTLTCTMY